MSRCAAGLLLSVCALAQTAGTKAVVIAPSAPVYAKMNTDAQPVATLERGTLVIIGMVLFGDETTWCLIQKPGETKRMGYVSCELVGPEKAAEPPPQAAEPAPPPSPPKQTPVVREVQPATLPVREATLAEVVKAAEPPKPEAPKPEPPKPAPVEAPPPARALGPWAVDDSGLAGLLGAYVRSTSIPSFLDKSRMEEIETELLRQLIARHFTAAAFARGVAAQLSGDTESMHAETVSRWLTGAGKSPGQLLRHASRPAARPELVAYAAKMRESPPSPARLEQIHRLWNATQSSDAEVDATMTIVRATALGLNPILPAAKRFTESALDDALGKVREAYKPVMKNARVVLYLFAFDGMADDSLEAYVAFWESPAGQWLAGRVRDGVAASGRTIARNLANDIGRRTR